MCETQEIRGERETETKGHWGSSWEYGDCRSLQRRDLPGLDDDLDSRDRTSQRNRPYRKRHCGYWDFEQSEASSMDYEEAKESGENYMHHTSGTRGCDGYWKSENVDCGNSSPGTGSPVVTWKAGEYEGTNGYVRGKNLEYNPKDSKETDQWTGYRGLDDSLGNFGQSQNWYKDHRNFNYNLEDCKGINICYSDLNDLYHVPGNYTNAQSVDLNGVNGGKGFVKYSEGDRNVYQNDRSYPKATTHALDQSKFETEKKVYNSLFENCEYELGNYRGIDPLHQMKNLEFNGIDRPGMMAFGSRRITPDILWNQRTRGSQGEHLCGIPQGSPLENTTQHLEEERKLNGSETWKRNSCFRRTAPSTLRRSEFVQNRKRTQGKNAVFLEVYKAWKQIKRSGCSKDTGVLKEPGLREFLLSVS